ncbi:MAG: alpha/beta hydrolase [Pseudomonadota bacterium]
MEYSQDLKHTWNQASSPLAVRRLNPTRADGTAPEFLWLGGFRSDMTGTKAQTMVDHCAAHGWGATRFDYSGHGVSGGAFVDGTLSRWCDEGLTVLRSVTSGPQVLVGSSMGGWIALLMARALQAAREMERIAGLLLIAPAPDFTETLMKPAFTEAQRALLASQGYIEEESAYSDEPTVITKALIEDGARNLVLDAKLRFDVPIAILQGMEDPDVPHTHALGLLHALHQDNVTMTLIKDGDHRLSRPQDLALLAQTMDRIASSFVGSTGT